MKVELLLEVWRVTERRGGATFKTEYVEDRWVRLEDSTSPVDKSDPDLIFVTKSTDYRGMTIRNSRNEG